MFMTLFQKFKWVGSISLVFLIVLSTNLIDQRNFNTLRDSVTTIYEDRIVANQLLFKMSMLIQEKEIALATLDSAFLEKRNNQINGKLEIWIDKYQQTKLTKEERNILNKLKEELILLERQKERYSYSTTTKNIELSNLIKTIDERLYALAKIQEKEGRRQMLISNEAISRIDLFTKAEIIFLIAMALLVPIIILYSPKKKA
jgi:hypothetical protein